MFLVKKIKKTGTCCDQHMTTDTLFTQIPVLAKYDMRILDETMNLKVSSLIARKSITAAKSVIIAKFDYIRSILCVDEVYIFMSNIDPNNKTILNFVDILTNAIKYVNDNNHNKRFESLVLEEIFKFIYEDFDTKLDKLAPKVVSINNTISNGSFGSRIKHDFVTVQTQHINLHYKIRDIKDLLDEISEQDGDELAEFDISNNLDFELKSKSSLNNRREFNQNVIDQNLTEHIVAQHIVAQHNVDSMNFTVEQLIDTYRKFFENMDDQLDMMKNTLETLLKIIDINIAEKRNDIARFDIKISIITLGVSLATFISSSYGMNLKNHMENMNYSFYIVNSIMVTIIFIIYIFTNKAFRNIVR